MIPGILLIASGPDAIVAARVDGDIGDLALDLGDLDDDADIDDDLRYIDRFISNLRTAGADTPPSERRPPEIWPMD